MEYDRFIKEVQTRGHMGSREEAERATRATLQTLAERRRVALAGWSTVAVKRPWNSSEASLDLWSSSMKLGE
jgi:hypothetical protein